MVKDIVKDPVFLMQPSIDATVMDISLIKDLSDTFKANRENCVGMAANMIGINKKIIVFENIDTIMIMVNPVIISKSGRYSAEEGCLSLCGIRKAERFQNITVSYLDENFRKNKQSFSGWTAQIIQHEIDHCNGVLI